MAKTLHTHPNTTYYVGDALDDLPTGVQFDVIVLLNVLEHLKECPAFLRQLVTVYRPSRILIRVPSYDRDWRVPLKNELGVDYRLDPTHEIEYTQATFRAEIEEAGLMFETLYPVWGELWAEVSPKEGKHDA